VTERNKHTASPQDSRKGKVGCTKEGNVLKEAARHNETYMEGVKKPPEGEHLENNKIRNNKNSMRRDG